MKKYIYTILLVWLAMVNVQAQENNEIQEPKPDEKVVVGAIGGTVDVTALGGASYTIPIQIPEGMGGIHPNLSIVYNSQSGNGLLGWGWTTMTVGSQGSRSTIMTVSPWTGKGSWCLMAQPMDQMVPSTGRKSTG